jgi:hypothetical protein
MKMPLKIMLAASVLVALPGCDQFREQVAGWIAPSSPAETLQSVDTLIQQGQLTEAKSQVFEHIDNAGELKHKFELAAARIYARQGDIDAALQYLIKAMAGQAITPSDAMTEPAFLNLQTDMRFLQIITGGTKEKPASKGETQVKASEDTQIKFTNEGTEVRAGDVVIKLPN